MYVVEGTKKVRRRYEEGSRGSKAIAGVGHNLAYDETEIEPKKKVVRNAVQGDAFETRRLKPAAPTYLRPIVMRMKTGLTFVMG